MAHLGHGILKRCWRRLTRWCRETFFRFDTPIRRRLREERRLILIAHSAGCLNERGKQRFAEINWWMGFNTVYDLTPEGERRMTELALDMAVRRAAPEEVSWHRE